MSSCWCRSQMRSSCRSTAGVMRGVPAPATRWGSCRFIHLLPCALHCGLLHVLCEAGCTPGRRRPLPRGAELALTNKRCIVPPLPARSVRRCGRSPAGQGGEDGEGWQGLPQRAARVCRCRRPGCAQRPAVQQVAGVRTGAGRQPRSMLTIRPLQAIPGLACAPGPAPAAHSST